MPRTILITGGAGLIGSALCERALGANAHVIVLDNLSTGRRENLPRSDRVELVRGDVCDNELVGTLVRRAERVFHLAAAVGVRLILERPTGTLRQSLLGTEIVLRHAAALRRPVFFASSSEVYGNAGDQPLREDQAVGFGSPETLRFSYAAGKAAGEALAFSYAAEYGLPVVVGRFFNVVGENQQESQGAVVPSLFGQAHRGGPLLVHGDGRQTRSFLDVEDAAEYVWRLMDRRPTDPDAPRGLFNIGRDDPLTIGELAVLVRDLVNPGLNIKTIEPDYARGFAPIHHRRPNVSRLLSALDYRPHVPLDVTLRRFLRSRFPARS